MERHLSPAALARLFSGQAAGHEEDAAATHLAGCRQCRDLASRAGGEAHLSAGLTAFLTLQEMEGKVALRRLLAHIEWAGLKNLSAQEQIHRFATVPACQTLEMFETVAADAAAVASADPFLGEERALAAHALAGLLPASCCSEPARNDLRGEAMAITASCRRLARDLRGSAAAVKTARGDLDRGTGDPLREAQLLLVQASLAADTGHLETALQYLARSAAIYRKVNAPAELAAVTIQEAGILLAAGRHEEAQERAEEALRWLTPHGARLEIGARSLVTECLTFRGRPAEALRSFLGTWRLQAQLGGAQAARRLNGLAAGLLDALGFAQEAETAYTSSAEACMEAELYKDAFLTMMTLFESLVRRRAWHKAGRACQTAIEMMERSGEGCPVQMVGLWRELLALVDTGRLTEGSVLAARSFAVRHWHVPAQRGLLFQGEVVSTGGGAEALHQHGAGGMPVEAPRPTASLSILAGCHEEALDSLGRQLVELSLATCGGCLTKAAAVLGISRNTLKVKIRSYGLDAEALAFPGTAQPRSPGLSESDQNVVSLLHGLVAWAELGKLPARQQIDRIKGTAALQTRELFEIAVAAAAAGALENPARGEELALVAQALARSLPGSRCSDVARQDLLCEVLMVIGNSRRLAGDGPGSAAAFAGAERHFARGTGDPAREARLLSVQASLASETGHVGEALALLGRAAMIHRNAQDAEALAEITLQEAGTLLAAGRYEEALERAEAGLRGLPRKAGRLELLARSLITECLAFLGRAPEALRSLAALWPLYEQFRGQRAELRLRDLEARVLAALGYEREAEVAYRQCIAGYMEARLYKDAFLNMMTRFESLLRRGAWDQAARACEEAIEKEESIKEAGDHSQTIAVWHGLLTMVRSRELSADRLLEAWQILVRQWSRPIPEEGEEPRGGPPPLRWDANGTTVPATPDQPLQTEVGQPAPLLTIELPPLEACLANGGYHKTLASVERRIIKAGLARCGGQVKPAAELLGIPRSTLQEKIERYGLKTAAGQGKGRAKRSA